MLKKKGIFILILIYSQQHELLYSANSKKNSTEEIQKTRKRINNNYEEKDLETSTLLNKKRQRQTIKRGSNCTWTVEDVYLFLKN